MHAEHKLLGGKSLPSDLSFRGDHGHPGYLGFCLSFGAFLSPRCQNTPLQLTMILQASM